MFLHIFGYIFKRKRQVPQLLDIRYASFRRARENFKDVGKTWTKCSGHRYFSRFLSTQLKLFRMHRAKQTAWVALLGSLNLARL